MSDALTCWAAVLGGCGGGPSAEHVVTEALLGKRVRLSGHLGPWLQGDAVEIPVRRLKANILCRDHNMSVGRHADRPAITFQRALRRSKDPMRLPGSRILRPPAPSKVSGVGLAKWLCKTHCNLMVVRGITPDVDYARYAFGQPTEKKLHFYSASQEGEYVSYDSPAGPAIHHGRLQVPEYPQFDAFVLGLAGFDWAVAPVPLARTRGPMLERPLMLRWPTPLGFYEIHMFWDGEPSWRRSVDDAPEGQEPNLREVLPTERLKLTSDDAQ